MIQVDNLHIRVPHMSEREATALGEQLAEKLANAFADIERQKTTNAGYRGEEIGDMRIQLNVARDMDHDKVADEVVANLLQQLKYR